MSVSAMGTFPFDRGRADARQTERSIALRAVGLVTLQAFLAGGAFLVLGDAFGFPDILREPAEVVLPRFQENADTIRRAYYAFSLSSLLAMPIAVLLHRLAAHRDTTILTLATAFGVASGVVQTLGFIRWPITIPYFAETYADPATSEATRAAIAVAYESLNRWQGMAIGEHLGWLLQGSWTLLLGAALLRHPALPRWLGALGILLGAGLLAGTPEQFEAGGEEILGVLNAVSTTATQFWFVALAIVLLLRARAIASKGVEDRS